MQGDIGAVEQLSMGQPSALPIGPWDTDPYWSPGNGGCLKFALGCRKERGSSSAFTKFGEYSGASDALTERKRETILNIWKGSSRRFNYRDASQIIYIGLLSCLPLSSGVFILIPVTSWSIRLGSVCTLVSFVAVWAFLSGNIVVCWSSIISALSPIWVKSWKLAQRLKNKTLK